MRKIIIIPFAGLCNRMRVISSGILIAQKYGVVPIISWQQEPGICNASFNDLFLPIPQEIATIKEDVGFAYKIWVGRRYYLQRKVQKMHFDQAIYNYNSLGKGDILPYINRGTESLLLCSCHRMGDYYSMSELFKPIQTIESRIQTISNDFGSKTIGVHIRRGDHLLSIKNSPLESFINRLDYFFDIGEADQAYLATDCASTKKILRNRYGARIITIEDSISRNTVNGMQGAVVDLFCLSKTLKILGSYSSSFSEIASELGNVELLLIID